MPNKCGNGKQEAQKDTKGTNKTCPRLFLCFLCSLLCLLCSVPDPVGQSRVIRSIRGLKTLPKGQFPGRLGIVAALRPALTATAVDLMRTYSYRSATTGLSRVACHAGHRHAPIATVTRSTVIDTSVTGSADPVWNS